MVEEVDLERTVLAVVVEEVKVVAVNMVGGAEAEVHLEQMEIRTQEQLVELADSSTRCNKDKPGNGWLRMSRHHGHSNRQVQVARCTSTSAEKNDTKFTAS